MPVFDEFDDPAFEDDERRAVIRRLDALMTDPVRREFSDPAVVAYTDRQCDRLTDANGAPIRSDFEPFRPAVQRSDLRLESPVGEGEANHPLAVFNTKKLLNKAGFHAFQPGIEGMGEASPRFLADLQRFQTAHVLAPDATAQPGGPTVHMLTRKIFGTADGPPPESESEHFEERFAKDPNRTLSGQPIFGAPGADGEDSEFGSELEVGPALEDPTLGRGPDSLADANRGSGQVGRLGDFEPIADGEGTRSDFLQLSEAQTAAIIGRQVRKTRNAPTLAQLAAFDIK